MRSTSILVSFFLLTAALGCTDDREFSLRLEKIDSLEAPDTVRAGQAFVFTIWTWRGVPPCEREGPMRVQHLSPSVVQITPLMTAHGNYVCPALAALYSRTVELAFESPGPATIVALGRGEAAHERVTIVEPIVVLQ